MGVKNTKSSVSYSKERWLSLFQCVSIILKYLLNVIQTFLPLLLVYTGANNNGVHYH